MSFETFDLSNGPEPQFPKKNEAERIELRRSHYAKPLGETVLARLLKENAAPKPGGFDQQIEDLRNPQNTAFYNDTEGFSDMFASEPSFGEAVSSVVDNGVEEKADGTYALKYQGSIHTVNAQGVPVEQTSIPKQ